MNCPRFELDFNFCLSSLSYSRVSTYTVEFSVVVVTRLADQSTLVEYLQGRIRIEIKGELHLHSIHFNGNWLFSVVLYNKGSKNVSHKHKCRCRDGGQCL